MTQREHDEHMLAICDEQIADCETAIIAIASIPEDRLRDGDKLALRDYEEAKAGLVAIREELLSRLAAA